MILQIRLVYPIPREISDSYAGYANYVCEVASEVRNICNYKDRLFVLQEVNLAAYDVFTLTKE